MNSWPRVVDHARRHPEHPALRRERRQEPVAEPVEDGIDRMDRELRMELQQLVAQRRREHVRLDEPPPARVPDDASKKEDDHRDDENRGDCHR